MLGDKENIDLIAESIVLRLETKGVSKIADLRKEEGTESKPIAELAQEVLDMAGKDIVFEFFKESIMAQFTPAVIGKYVTLLEMKAADLEAQQKTT